MRELEPLAVESALAERAAILQHFDALIENNGLAAPTRGRYCPPEKREAIAARLRDGAKMETICAELHTNIKTVRAVRRAIGLPDRRRSFECYQRRTIFALHRQGLTLSQIAAQVGSRKDAVWYVLRHAREEKPQAKRESGRRPPSVDYEHVAELIRTGMHSTAIAARLNVSSKTIRQVAHRYGLILTRESESDAG